MTKQIPLTHGKFALIDDEDYDLVKGLKWQAKKGGKTWSVSSSLHGPGPQKVFMGRLILDAPPDLRVMYLKGDPFDLRRSNIRLATRSELYRYVAKHDSVAGMAGVTRLPETKHGYRYRAMISVGDKKLHIGTYDTPEEAHAAYLAAERAYFGDVERRPKKNPSRGTPSRPATTAHYRALAGAIRDACDKGWDAASAGEFILRDTPSLNDSRTAYDPRRIVAATVRMTPAHLTYARRAVTAMVRAAARR